MNDESSLAQFYDNANVLSADGIFAHHTGSFKKSVLQFRSATEFWRRTAGLLHHCGRGVQYAANGYVD